MLIFTINDGRQKAKLILRHKLAENFDRRQVFLEEEGGMILCENERGFFHGSSFKLTCAKSQDFSEYLLGGHVFKPFYLQSPQVNKDLVQPWNGLFQRLVKSRVEVIRSTKTQRWEFKEAHFGAFIVYAMFSLDMNVGKRGVQEIWQCLKESVLRMSAIALRKKKKMYQDHSRQIKSPLVSSKYKEASK